MSDRFSNHKAGPDFPVGTHESKPQRATPVDELKGSHSGIRFSLLLKAVFDRSISFVALVFLFPVILLVSAAVALSVGFPIVFRQRRPGLNGTPFNLYKFRTMTDARDESGRLLPDEARLTRVGNLLRCHSLDELPQLWNVLRGDISLVGPRPLLMQYLERYTPEQSRRHDVLPGITGWAQVNGRNALTWEEKFALDIWYVDNWSFFLDLRILLKTLAKVFQRESISQPGCATAVEFMGTTTQKTFK
jgi:sugar transferase EpsL